MTDLSDRDAFVRRICEVPGDDLPRLVYADWLEENGEPERAEFIRVQVELAKRHSPSYVDGSCVPCDRRSELMARENKLLFIHMAKWLHPSPTPYPPVIIDVQQMGWGLRHVTRLGDTYMPVVFRRGFVAEVRGPMAALYGAVSTVTGMEFRDHATSRRYQIDGPTEVFTPGHLPAIVAAHPVERVVVTDQTTYFNGAGYGWFNPDRPRSSSAVPANCVLPEVLFDLLENWLTLTSSGHRLSGRRYRVYATRELAVNALSAALLNWARGEANLPPLASV